MASSINDQIGIKSADSENEFPSFCTMCNTKFKVKNCLLPYALINSVALKGDVIDQIMQIGQIHQEFGMDKLTQAFEYLNSSILTTATNDDKTDHSKASEAKKKSKRLGKKKFEPLETIKAGEVSPAKEDFPALPECAKPLMEENCPSIIIPIPPKSVSKTWSERSEGEDDLSDMVVETQAFFTKDNVSTPAVEQRRESSHSETYVFSDAESSHLFQDMLIAFKGIFQIAYARRMHFKQNTLFYALNYESNLRRTRGKNYVRPVVETIDGNFSLAKLIHLMHDLDQISDWEKGLHVRNTKCCILDSTPFKVDLIGPSMTIVKALAAYIAEVRFTPDVSVYFRDDLLPMIEFSLTKDKLNEAFKMGISEARKFSSHNTMIRQLASSKSLLNVGTSTKKEYPPISEDVKKFTELRTQICVGRVLNLESNRGHSVTGFDKPNVFYLKLVNEFILRYANWLKPDSLKDARRLGELEEYLGIKIPQMQTISVYNIMRQILEVCRSDFRNNLTS